MTIKHISVLVILVIMAFEYSSAESDECGPNAIDTGNRCNTACPPRCPSSRPPRAAQCMTVCNPDPCVCKRGYLRNSLNQCVLPENCS